MKKKRILAVILAAAMAFGMTACGGDKPAETTKAAETEAKKAEAETTKAAEITKAAETTAPTEAETEAEVAKVPDNGILFQLTNPKIQAQASFYLPKLDSEWEIKPLNGKDPIDPIQRYEYKAKFPDYAVIVDARLAATTEKRLAVYMEKGEKVKVSGYDAVFVEEDLSWNYTVDVGPYAEGLELYMTFKIYSGSDRFKTYDEVKETRDMLIETLSATTDYEGKEDRSGRLYQGSGLCSLPMTFEYNGQEVEVKQGLRDASVYVLNATIYEDGDIPLKISATIGNTCKSTYMDVTDGYVDCTIAGYPGKLQQTEYPNYVQNYVRLKVNDTVYEMYATTTVDSDKITDTIALAAAIKAFKEDTDPYYEMSLNLLEAMVSAAEFRDAGEAWIN